MSVMNVAGATWEFVGADAEERRAAEEPNAAERSQTKWQILSGNGVMRPPAGLSQPHMALRTDRCVADETVSCDFTLHAPEGQFGLVFGAQDAGHYYWAYYPRWGQNWRARAFYAVIARVDGDGHARGLAMMLMPNVVTHWNAELSMRVERRGNHFQMYVNDVKGPFAIDDTYGAGRAGVAGFGDYEVRTFHVHAAAVQAGGADASMPAWKSDTGRREVWFTPAQDTGYGFIREPFALLKLAGGEIVAGINSRHGPFHGPEDPGARVTLYRSQDAGRTWSPHGEPRPKKEVPDCFPWGLRWFEPAPGVIRAFHHGPAVIRRAELLEGLAPEEILSFRDSRDLGLTWGEPQPSHLVGDWNRELYRPGCWNHIYGFTQLRDGTLLAVFLHGYEDLYPNILRAGQGTWGTEIAQPYLSRSEDGGLTWQEPVPMDDAALYQGEEPDSPHGGFSETALAELPGGRIVGVCRPYRSPFSWQTHSDDGGRTWRLVCYAPFSVAGGPQMVATRSGYLALVARQTGLALHTSVDGGVNWDAGTLLAHDCWFNGFLTKAEPDVILVFYYHPSVDGVQPSLPRMQRIRITADGPVPADR